MKPRLSDRKMKGKKSSVKGKKGEGAGKQTGQAMMFNHALGQHILKNPLIVQALVDKVGALLVFFMTSCLCLLMGMARPARPFLLEQKKGREVNQFESSI